jgi:hypothetical protein
MPLEVHPSVFAQTIVAHASVIKAMTLPMEYLESCNFILVDLAWELVQSVVEQAL